MLLHDYKLFISHGFEEHDDYGRLTELLDSVTSFGYTLCSVPKDFKYRKMTKENLEETVKRQLKPVNCVLILDSVYLAHPQWVSFQIKQAVFAKKPIIGIRQLRTKDISSAIGNVADEVVGWNPELLVKTIKDCAVYATSNI